jgi:Hemerythrin HHE cation binding domain
MSRAEVGEVYEASTTALEAAKGQRLSLRRAIGQLEEALTEPAVGRAKDWAANLEPVLDDLKTVFSVHVEVTEGAGGLYEEIMENTPRLANKIDRFTREHASITHQLDQAMASARLIQGQDATASDDLRDALVRLFADLVRHRRRGVDLVYEAYHVDIGGES